MSTGLELHFPVPFAGFAGLAHGPEEGVGSRKVQTIRASLSFVLLRGVRAPCFAAMCAGVWYTNGGTRFPGPDRSVTCSADADVHREANPC